MDNQTLLKITYDHFKGRLYNAERTGSLGHVFQVEGFSADEWNVLWPDLKKSHKQFIREEFVFQYCKTNCEDQTELLVYFESGITLHKYPGELVELVYAPTSDQQRVQQMIYQLRTLVQHPTTHQVGLIRTHGPSLDVQFCDYKLYDVNLIPFMGTETQEFYHRTVVHLKSDSGVGLYLLYGPPGTGKTSFLKQAIHEAGKKALYLSPSFTESLTSPELTSLLLRYPDSLLIIEDAESVLMKRAADNSSSVSNLLNLTDGFLSDFLKLKIICTFNTDLEEIDPALLREGRLKGVHRFGKVDADRARKIAEALGQEMPESSPMTIAEICNGKTNGPTKRNKLEKKRVGFTS